MRLLAVVQTADEWPDDIRNRIRQTPISIYFLFTIANEVKFTNAGNVQNTIIIYTIRRTTPVTGLPMRGVSV